MEIFKYVALVLLTSNVQFSCYQITENDGINLGLKVSTLEYSKDEDFEYNGALCDKQEKDDEDHITNFLGKLGIDDGYDHITNLKLILEDNEREVKVLPCLQDQYYGNDHNNWETESNLNKPYFNLVYVIHKLGERLPETSKIKIWNLKESLDEVYWRILNLIKKEKKYNYNQQVFYITLLQTINEDLSVSHKLILKEGFERVDRLMKNPLIHYYFKRITGIPDLKEFYKFNNYKKFKKLESSFEDDDLSRKLSKQYKKSIKKFIELVLNDIFENDFPLASIIFILDKVEVDIVPTIENIYNQSQSRVKRNSDVSYSKKHFDKGFRNGESKDFDDEQIKQAQAELKIFIEEITDMAIQEIFEIFDGWEMRR